MIARTSRENRRTVSTEGTTQARCSIGNMLSDGIDLLGSMNLEARYSLAKLTAWRTVATMGA